MPRTGARCMAARLETTADLLRAQWTRKSRRPPWHATGSLVRLMVSVAFLQPPNQCWQVPVMATPARLCVRPGTPGEASVSRE
jgi:hypothetical protein